MTGIKRISFSFNPLLEKTESIRRFCFIISEPRWRLSNAVFPQRFVCYQKDVPLKLKSLTALVIHIYVKGSCLLNYFQMTSKTVDTFSNMNSAKREETVLVFSRPSEKYICLVCVNSLDSKEKFFKHLTLQHGCVDFLHGEGQTMISTQFDWIRFINYVRRNKPSNLREAFHGMAWKTDSHDLLYPVLPNDEVLSIDMSELITSNGNPVDSEYDSDGWQEVTLPDSLSSEKYICLMCEEFFNSVPQFFRHLTIQHDWVNFLDGEGRSIFNDQYDWIRFVNFVRKTQPTDIRQTFYDMIWKTDSIDLLYPVLVDDEVLSIDIELYLVDNQRSRIPEKILPCENTTESREIVILPPSKEINCKRLLSNMAKDTVKTKSCSSSRSPDHSSDIEPYDSSYFGSYGHFEIHGEMINDRIRTDSYVNFILSNSKSILSMIASQAGAAHVYGVEAADEIFAASHETLRVNNLLGRITIIHGQAESVELPVKQVDVIISEYCIKYLSPNGHIFPRHYTLHLLGVQCSDKLRERRLEHWNNVYGYNMPALRRAALSEAHILNLTNEQQMSLSPSSSPSKSPITILTPQSYELISLDLQDMHKKRVYHLSNHCSILYEQNFSLLIQPTLETTTTAATDDDNFKLDAIVGYFDVRFDDNADTKIEFSTSPTAPLTHWKQTLLFLDKPITVKSGEIITGRLTIRRATTDNRGLEINLFLNETENSPETYWYHPNQLLYILHFSISQDFTCFTNTDFNHIQWINEALKSSDPKHLDQKASDLVLQLQTQMKDVMQTLGHICQEAISSIPRVLREIESVKTDVLTLDCDVKTLQHNNLQMDTKSQSIVNSLVDLDKTRKNAQSAADALRETDRWICLFQSIDELFETGDLDQLCSTIEGMDQCLASLIHVTDYDERVKRVDNYKNSLESLIAPQLIQSLDDLSSFMMKDEPPLMMNGREKGRYSGDGDDEGKEDAIDILTTETSLLYYAAELKTSRHLINLLYRIGREDAAKNYYRNWLKDKLTNFWNRSFSQTTESSATTDSLLLASVIRRLSTYPSNLTGTNQRTKINCLAHTSENDNFQDINSSILINNTMYFYSLLICFFKGQLGARLFHKSQKDHHLEQEISYPIGLVLEFTNLLVSFQPFQTFTNSLVDYRLVGCLFRLTVRCLQCFEELLIPFDSFSSDITHSDVVTLSNDGNNHVKDDSFVNHLKNAYIRLIQGLISPFIGLPELFAKFLRKQFDQELNTLNITVSNNPSHIWDKLHQNVVSRSFDLFYASVDLCFEETGAVSLPFVLDIIHSYWDSLIAKWMVWNSWIEKQLIKSDSELSYNQAFGFMWVLKFAQLTVSDLSSRSDAFVEYVMSKCANWLSQICNHADSSIFSKENHTVTSSKDKKTDSHLSIPNIFKLTLHQLVLKQSTECQQAIHILAYPPNLTSSSSPSSNSTESISKSKSSEVMNTTMKSRNNLNGLHKSSSMLCRATVGIVRQVTLAPIRYYLKTVPNLSVWFTYPSCGESCLPDLAYLPQDYITQIGQYLFMLPAQLEPYASIDSTLDTTTEESPIDDYSSSPLSLSGLTHCLHLGDSDINFTIPSHRSSESQHQQEDDGKTPSESSVYCWLENLISVNVCDLILNTILQIGLNKSTVKPLTTAATMKSDHDESDDTDDQPLLTKHGLKQLDVDLGYFFSMLHDLSISVPSNLQTLRDLISCQADEFPKLSADRPPKIVNAVANFRGF
ncbi:unnamed protein product [Heterobilharzia americana]|nr:unnamed protein product [Heterobilharzia americana]